MSNLRKHAIRELSKIGMNESEDGINGDMYKHIIKMVELFDQEGHSGFSANYAIGIINKLLKFEPLSPLTGEDNEWIEVGGGLYQNNRCHHVFKQGDVAYDIDGKVFKEPDGSCYTNSESKVNITFPYVPKTIYIEKDE